MTRRRTRQTTAKVNRSELGIPRQLVIRAQTGNFFSEKQANKKMAQKGLMRILSRKDGKGTVSDDKDSEKVLTYESTCIRTCKKT